MRVRKLDTSGDMTFGRSAANYYYNDPLGVAQVVGTRLRLFVGDWFLDLTQGTPWQTQVLGPRTGSTRDAVVRARILGTPGVSSIDTYGSVLNRETRAFSITAAISTIYGSAPVNIPAVPVSITPQAITNNAGVQVTNNAGQPWTLS